MSGLRRALIGLAIAGLALGLAALALVTASDRDDDSTAWIVLALTLGSVDLVLLPYGTALGCYTLWALLNEEGKKFFEMQSAN